MSASSSSGQAKVLRVIGPPGTGKTAFLAAQVGKWVSEGIPPDRIVGCSFTRAAAAVLRGRITEIPPQNFATLHALAYRGLGSPPIAETGELRRQWNEQAIPEEWKIGADKADLEEGFQEEGDYGSMLAAYNLYRAGRSWDGLLWERVRYFAERWEDFKTQTQAVDFQDMIDLALLELPVCPGDPVAFVVDEAQDLTPTQWALAQKWGHEATHYLVAGDPAQVLYSFAGANPAELLEPLPVAQHRLLHQSYRLPPLLQQHAEHWLGNHSPPMVEGRQYRPREGLDGELCRIEFTWREPLGLAELLERYKGLQVMLLASCSYMLGPSIAELRLAGIPFHNPYRSRNKAWNPLGRPRTGAVSTAQRVKAFLCPTWSSETAAAWLTMLPAEWFLLTKKGAMVALAQWESGISEVDVTMLLQEQAWAPVRARDLPWLAQAVAKPYQRPVQHIGAIIGHSGVAALDREPQVTVGTIHSVKGAEADAVVLYPDLPQAALEEAATSTGRDAVIRQFYVGYSRAKETLVLATPAQAHRSIEAVLS